MLYEEGAYEKSEEHKYLMDIDENITHTNLLCNKLF